ncbi:MAG: ATP-dependent DNA helicase RecG [Armatimonadetes bacterium]|nr:ATP-dependent DNA helicase RecG [Armatimonadota bacterium]
MSQGLATEVQFLKGVGPRFAQIYKKIGIETAEDVLFHLPRRYQDRRDIPPIARARPGQVVTIIGRVRRVESRPIGKGRVLLRAIVEDSSGAITLTWFNQPWLKKQLDDARQIIAYGLVKSGTNLYEISSPEWEAIDDEDEADAFAQIVPVYPLTEGLPQKVARRAAESALATALQFVDDPLPESLLRSQKLRDLQWCLQQIHHPESEEARLLARRRIVFEEFLYMQLELAMRRAETQQELGIAFPIRELEAGKTVERPAPLMVKEDKRAKRTADQMVPQDLFFEEEAKKREGEPLWTQIGRMLPFTLTDAQDRVIREVFADMALPSPMNRLVQGDVGAGKTAVAACCLLAAVRSGFQCALMAPTEILAEQHFKNLRGLFEPLGIHVELLVGKLGSRDRKAAYQRLENGSAQIAVGTHALIQEGVTFQSLGFVVVDEQHRFGVLQRKAIRDKGYGNPDVLVMTATPIPRTLTMTVFGDLDVSIIDQLPPGRKPIKTHHRPPFQRDSVYSKVRELVDQGRQAYFVCPMVSENEKMMAQAAEELYRQLSTGVFIDFKVGLLHGQMKSADKDDVMEQFRAGELQILVATTVIEVGVDVPNASVMVIEDANRFGLAQLHQLRGRVGRGETQSYCILISDTKSEDVMKRMDVMVSTTDGFRIAEEDLEIRGPGNIAGTEQSGSLDFKVADLVQDSKLLEVARQAAMRIIEDDPTLSGSEWAKVRTKLKQRRSDVALITVS